MESVLGYLLANMESEELGHSWRCILASLKVGSACNGLLEGVYGRTRLADCAGSDSSPSVADMATSTGFVIQAEL